MPSTDNRCTTPVFFQRILNISMAIALVATPNVLAEESTSSPGQRTLHLSLTNLDGLTVEGPHRFQTVAGRRGFRPTSLKTRALIQTDLHHSPQGTLTFWFSPLEDNDNSRLVGPDPKAMVLPLVSDYFPPRDEGKMRFGVYWNGSNYPRLIGRFQSGRYWTIMDHRVGPMVYADRLPLRRGQWYHVALTWDQPARKLVIYVNGQLVGHHLHAEGFEEPGSTLYLGNPLMVLSELTLHDQVLNESQIQDEYTRLRPAGNDPADRDVRQVAGPVEQPPLDVQRDTTWKETYRCSFTNPKDLDEWTFQTGDQYRDQFELKITDDGLYWRTPDAVDRESRGYLWCSQWFEGDQWVEYDFRLESPRGLALLILCASGMQGEDVIEDHGLLNTGSMSPMLERYRNYHWEYVRRVESMRTDVETQYVNKNPWGKSLHVGCFPRLQQNVWHRMRWVKIGRRLHGSIDGKTVFDVTIDPYNNNGPAFDAGRIVLRQMYHTAMSYRDFVVYQRP